VKPRATASWRRGTRAPPVVFAFAGDDRFAMQVGVTLAGVMGKLSAGRSARCFLLDGGIEADNRRRIEAIAAAHDRLELEWIEAPAAQPDLALTDPVLKHLSSAALLRLKLPDVLPGEDRVLYLDSDVLITGDLAPLWDTRLAGHVVGAVQDFAFPTVEAMLDRMPEDQAPLKEGYEAMAEAAELFNSGVMVMDLALLRARRVSRLATEYLRAHPRLADGDALNNILQGQWAALSPEWNLQTGWSDPSSLAESRVRACLMQMGAPLRRTAVVHFTGYDKPWEAGSRQPLVLAYARAVLRSGWFSPREYLDWGGGLLYNTCHIKLGRRREKLLSSLRTLTHRRG